MTPDILDFLESWPGRWFTGHDVADRLETNLQSTRKALGRLAVQNAVDSRRQPPSPGHGGVGRREYTLPVFDKSPRVTGEWKEQGNCWDENGRYVDLFLPDVIDEPHNPRAQKVHNGIRGAKARAMCRSCPVQGECHEYIQSKPIKERFGTWGGATYEDGPYRAYRYQLGPWLVGLKEKV